MEENKIERIKENLKWISEHMNELCIGEVKKLDELNDEMYRITSKIVNDHTLYRKFLWVPNEENIF